MLTHFYTYHRPVPLNLHLSKEAVEVGGAEEEEGEEDDERGEVHGDVMRAKTTAENWNKKNVFEKN